MSDRIPMTRTGYDKIKAEVDHLNNEELPKILQRVADARAEGDLTENAEYDGARESMRMMEAKINELRNKLAHAQIIERANVDQNEIAFGATVKVKDLDLDDEEEFTLVGAGEEDYAAGKINVASPLAQGLVGHKLGEKVDIEVPAGTLHFEILEVRYEQ